MRRCMHCGATVTTTRGRPVCPECCLETLRRTSRDSSRRYYEKQRRAKLAKRSEV